MSEQQVRLGWHNWYGMVIAIVFPKAVGVTTAIMARSAGHDIWVAELVAIALAVVLVALAALGMTWLRTPLSQALKRSVSPVAGKLADLTLLVLLALGYVAGNYVFLGHVQYFFLPQTPLVVFNVAVGTLSLVASLMGMEVLARVALIGTAGHVMLTAVTVPGVVWDVNTINLLPIAHHPPGPLFTAVGVALADLSLPVALAVTTLPLVEPTGKGWVKHSILATLLAGGLVMLWPLGEILVLGPNLTARSTVACMVLARAASLGMYVHRYELIMLLFFLPGIFLASALPLYGAANALTQLLGLKQRRLVTMAAVLGLGWISHAILGNRLWSDWFLAQWWPPLVLGLSLTLLLLALGGGLVARYKRGRQQATQ